MALRIDLGSANLKGSFGFGKREDYTYDVPDGAIHVSLEAEDNSSDSLNIGDGNGKVTLKWDREEKKARVHAWVNGAAGSPNEVRWTVYAWILYPGGEHKVHQEPSVPLLPAVSGPSSMSLSSTNNIEPAHDQTQAPTYKLKKEEAPTLPLLLNFPTGTGDNTINITRDIGTQYKTFGTLLLDDDNGSITDALENKYQRDAPTINYEILKLWLQGTGKKPITWAKLVKVLQQVELKVLANKIEASLL